jgi:hypothetical protein
VKFNFKVFLYAYLYLSNNLIFFNSHLSCIYNYFIKEIELNFMSALNFPINLSRILFRSLKVRSKRLILRANYFFGFRKMSQLNIKILPWSSFASVPGNSQYLPGRKINNEYSSLFTNQEWLFNHKFEIFGKNYICDFVNSADRKLLMQNYLPEVSESDWVSYKPIEWHTDFSSGYQWSPTLFFQDVKMAPKVGVEIKFPRELSRFQHIGAMAYSKDYDKASIEFILQVTDWIVANPFGKGVNWECSMDVSLRAINWIWGIRFFERKIVKHEAFNKLISNSLRDHGRHIYENLDYYGDDIPTGNHYLADIVGLVYIGAVLPDIPESDIFLAFGIQELISEMKREVLEDGMCHEASTSYHRLVAELFVSGATLIEKIPYSRRMRLKNVNIRSHKVLPKLRSLEDSGCDFSKNRLFLPYDFYTRLGLMGDFTLHMRKPNGLVFHLGDNDSARVHKFFPALYTDSRNHDHLIATIGALLGKVDLLNAGFKAKIEAELLCGDFPKQPILNSNSVTSRIKLFNKCGIAIHSLDNAWLGVSCGFSGQGGRGGHGHNDKNSFELNINGIDFIVDGGCPNYTSFLNVRNSYRSTFAHNTLAVENDEQNKFTHQLSGVCSLPERANPNLNISEDIIIGNHDGFGSTHSRRFELKKSSLIITDHFKDNRKQFLLFNFHPEVDCKIIKASASFVEIILIHKSGTSVQLNINGVNNPVIKSGFFSTGYGQTIFNNLLSVDKVFDETKIIFEW